jgi:Replication-relaxation
MTPNAVTTSESKEPRRHSRRLPIVVTDRDVRVLRELFDSRLLTTSQLAAIHFDARIEAAKQRLHHLKKAKLITGRARISPAEPQPIKLTRDGFQWLRDHAGLDDYPRLSWGSMRVRLSVSDLTLRHELAVGDVKAAFYNHARKHEGVTIDRFVTWPRLLRFKNPDARSSQKLVSPDGFTRMSMAIAEQSVRYDCFLEIDRGTETIGRILARAVAYVQHYKGGAYAKRLGGDPNRPHEYPFRVLWTFPSRSRLRNFAEACRKSTPPILKMHWLAVQADVVTDPFSDIWVRPVDDDAQRHGLLANPAKRAESTQ